MSTVQSCTVLYCTGILYSPVQYTSGESDYTLIHQAGRQEPYGRLDTLHTMHYYSYQLASNKNWLSSLRFGTLIRHSLQYSAIQSNTIPFIAIQCNTKYCTKIQHIAMNYNTLHCKVHCSIT